MDQIFASSPFRKMAESKTGGRELETVRLGHYLERSSEKRPEQGPEQGPVTALVTAYNEAETIGDVIAALKAAPSIVHVHVVDDASEDDTRNVALCAGAEVTTLPRRVPVGEAIMAHLDAITDEGVILWCDADLINLNPEHIEDLIARFRRGDVSQSLSSRAVPLNWPAPLRQGPAKWAWIHAFGPISGERVMMRSTFERAILLARKLDWDEMMYGYGIVLFLNWFATAFGNGHAITYCEHLRQRQKYQKWGRRAFGQMIRQWAQFISVWFRIRFRAGDIQRLYETDETHRKIADEVITA